VLNGVKILQGDGIDYDEIGNILNGLEENRYSASNIVFGSGGALLQKFNRDTMKFAMKCSAIKVNGEWRGVFKDPVTDPGKKSKIGRVTLYKNREGYHSGVEDWENPVLRTVYENGKLIIDESFNDIRKRLLESQNHGVK
jgi:nicotinamide phosphoribosyltransferase